MLGQAGRLSERQRVKPRLSLHLIRIRYFVVSLIPWSEAGAVLHPRRILLENRPCFRTFFIRKLVNFIAGKLLNEKVEQISQKCYNTSAEKSKSPQHAAGHQICSKGV